MNAELFGPVNDGGEIVSSGRWDALNQKIASFAQSTEIARHWHFATLTSIWHQIASEYTSLKDIYQSSMSNDLSLLAWRSRNILELRVWAAYFCQSEQNARRIFEDAGRDALDIIETFRTGGKVADSETDLKEKLDVLNAIVRKEATEIGIDDLDRTYKAVRDAARECGLAHEYSLAFKFFSKFAHPTAYQIVIPISGAHLKSCRDVFFSQGSRFFALGFACLENYLNSGVPPWKLDQ